MRRLLALIGAVPFGTIGIALAAPVTAFPEATRAIQLPSAPLLLQSGANGQLNRGSAQSNDRALTGGFRTELDVFAASLDIPGNGTSPIGNTKATRLMLSGLYEFSS